MTEPMQFINAKQVAFILGKHVTWIIRARAKPGKGPPFYKIGRRFCYRETEIMEWLNQQRKE